MVVVKHISSAGLVVQQLKSVLLHKRKLETDEQTNESMCTNKIILLSVLFQDVLRSAMCFTYNFKNSFSLAFINPT